MTVGFSRRRVHTLRLVMTAWVTISLLSPLTIRAQHDERSVRAAFVYNLTKYVTWPKSTGDLSICVLGDGATGAALKLVVDGKTSDGRTIHVVREPLDHELSQCDIAYWSDTDSARLRSMLEKARGRSVLTVGENDQFVRDGGMVSFVRSGDSIQIEVNVDSIRSGNLKISSRLLELAVLIHEGKRG